MDLTQAFLEAAAQRVRTAGQIVRNYFGEKLPQIAKLEGFVTQADLETERYLIKELRHLLPEADILAEETASNLKTAEYCWVIDPLDGTTNFSRKLPYFAVSVALTRNCWPVLGIIYNPALDQLFYGAQGVGLYLDGTSLPQIDGPALNESLVGMSFSYQTFDNYHSLWLAAERVRLEVYSLRQFGSVALDLANLAAGRIDAAFFKELHWWDVAAGLCLAELAGAKISCFKGGKIDQKFSSCLVAGPKIHSQLVSLLKNY